MYLVALLTINVGAKVYSAFQADPSHTIDNVNVAVCDRLCKLTLGNWADIISAYQHGRGHISRRVGGETKEDNLLQKCFA